MAAASPTDIPRWVDYLLVPLVNLAVALLLTGVVVLAIGANPLDALDSLLFGAVGYPEAIGFTLYYATNFIFTGLAVAVAFHAGLFNIGGEGQAYIGGLGCGLAILAFDHFLPAWAMIPLAIAAAALFGAAWAAVPAWLQAWRGSHIVITTIMFNFLAAALMVYLMVNVLIAPGSMTPQSRNFADSAKLPSMQATLAAVLFGALYQGGSELSFEMPKLTRDMVVVIQGLIILVCGALEYALRGPIEAQFRHGARAEGTPAHG